MFVLEKMHFVFLLLPQILSVGSEIAPECQDKDPACREWTTSGGLIVCNQPGYIRDNCPRSCKICLRIPPEYDATRVPDNLKPIEFLIGIWRSEHDGHAFFPTIPRFTFGEQVEFKLPGAQFSGIPALNYSTFAWAMNGNKIMNEELHSETGYLTVKPGTTQFSLTTVMSNGFSTVEEGTLNGNRTLTFRLVDIGRISFSRDLPVHDIIREWRWINPTVMEARLSMETLTHSMREHTTVVYRKIFP
ncbi:hypothetical protein M3Y96_00249000 [Aphelenchoides besseyi]|nr:hypothetical protein M3Y96_00249000 [Aphelenchoides besseyi]